MHPATAATEASANSRYLQSQQERESSARSYPRRLPIVIAEAEESISRIWTVRSITTA